MNLMEKFNQQKARLDEMIVTSFNEGRDLTPAEVTELEKMKTDLVATHESIKRAAEAQELFKSVAGMKSDVDPLDGPSGGRTLKAGHLNLRGGQLREGLKAAMVDGQKQLIANGATVIPVEITPGVQLTERAPLTLLEAFDVVKRDAPTYRFLRESARTNNAAVVAPGATKPTSVYTITSVDARLRVIAHLSEAIDKYLLEDAGNLQQFIEAEMVDGLNYALEAEVLTGDGTGEHMTGLANTSGIQTQTGTSALGNLRTALTKLEVLSQTPKFFALNPSDWATIETARNASGNFDFGSPAAAVDRRLWGVPVVATPALAAGASYLVANGAAVISTDGRIDARWDSTGTLFDKNQLKARAESRFNLDVLRPLGIVKITTTAP